MKRPSTACSRQGGRRHRRIDGLVRWFTGLALALLLTACAQPPPADRSVATAEIGFAPSETPPVSGWQRRALVPTILTDEARTRGANHVFARFTLAGRHGPQTLLITDMRERLTVSLNGISIFSNADSADDPVLGWNHPYRIMLPPQLLRPGANQVMLTVSSYAPWQLGLGRVWAGPAAAIDPWYRYLQIWRIDGTRIANALLLALTGMTMLLWLARRQERELLWLTIIGLGWYARNLHFFLERTPVAPELFAQVTRISVFLVVPMTFAFCAEFFRIKGSRRFIFWVLGLGLADAIAYVALGLAGLDQTVCALILIAIGVATLALLLRGDQEQGGLQRPGLQRAGPERWWMLAVVAVNIIMAVHDLGRVWNLAMWDGAGFFFQPYAALMLFGVFFLSVGRRFIAALATTEDMNNVLSEGIEAARADLAASEAQRRALEVSRAIEGERERLMREMHDGIGANLVTALAVAEQQGQPESTTRTLRKALADLKITVDSLEPLQGDLVALIANLRHRMAPDLADAGLSSQWQVQPCPALPWLDAANALHVLRIVQEAIGNVIVHAGATTVTVGCSPGAHDGAPGIITFVADDGCGLPAAAEVAATGTGRGLNTGRGLGNMQARAAALHGHLGISSGTGRDTGTGNRTGTRISLWLPLTRG